MEEQLQQMRAEMDQQAEEVGFFVVLVVVVRW